ncbi:MAG: hypothetical protein KIH62_002190 [Candidatus Kerfeldbacteria bacterium]|nr:hypothetical protein [Candidatus Kerfeldbacteria bacterium]
MPKNKPTPDSIELRQQKQKELLLDMLKKTPIIQLACQKADVGRATYYRWLKEDHIFAEAAQTALTTGVNLVNDMAESQLISAIKDKRMPAIIFWLKHHHSAYATRVELTGNQSTDLPELTEEQQKIVHAALEQAKLLTDEKDSEYE